MKFEMFVILSSMVLVALPATVANHGVVLHGSLVAWQSADAGAASGGNEAADVINGIANANLRLILASAALVVARAAPKALTDSEITAWAIAAATSFWAPPVSRFYVGVAQTIRRIRPIHDKVWKAIEWGANGLIVALSIEAHLALLRYPKAVVDAALDAAMASGAEVAAFVPLTLPGDLSGSDAVIALTGAPTFGLRSARLSDLCDAVKRGSPSNPRTEDSGRIFSERWGWPKDKGVSDWARENLHVNKLFWGLFMVAGPLHLNRRVNAEEDTLCDDDRRGPVLFDGELDPDPERLLRRTRFVVVTLKRARLAMQVPSMEGGVTFAPPGQEHDAPGMALQELSNDVSLTSEAGFWRQRLGPVFQDILLVCTRLIAGFSIRTRGESAKGRLRKMCQRAAPSAFDPTTWPVH